MVFGMILALARMGRAARIDSSQPTYINIFRGIPALVSVIWVYFGWSLLVGYQLLNGISGWCDCLSHYLYSAFFAEIFRSALTALSPGQSEAGLAFRNVPWEGISISDQAATGNQDCDSQYRQHVHRDGQGYFCFYGHRTC